MSLVRKIKRAEVQPKKEEKSELEDVWATGPEDNKIVRKFKAFTNSNVTKVKAIIPPMAGHSFNPSA